MLPLEERLLGRCDSETFVPVAVGSRGLDILSVLITRAGDTVSKDEIITAVWPGTIVEDSNLTVQISAVRRVLDQGRLEGSCIQTTPGRGYRFAVPARRLAMDAGSNNPAAESLGIRLPPRMSIVVLPFLNLSGDADQQYFADAITDDVTTDLSRLADMSVISRNTAFTYRNKQVDTKQISHELGVRFALEGSVRRAGNRFCVNTQLIDASTDAHLWAERFEGDTSNLFTAHNEITGRIANVLDLEVVAAEVARPTELPDALDYILRGRAERIKPPSPENYAKAIDAFERVLALDPLCVEAQSRLASVIVDRMLDFRTRSAEADVDRADKLATRALAASPRSSLAHFAKAQVLRVQGRVEEAIVEYEQALALNCNWVSALAAIGRCKLFLGRIEEAILAQEQAIRLSPRDPYIGIWYFRVGQAHLISSRFDEAVLWFERACWVNPAPHIFSRLSRCGLRSEGRHGTRQCRTRRGPKAEHRRSVLEHR